MTGLLKFLFFLIVIRPLVLVFLGLNVRHGEHLPQEGPAIIVANHNSHLDTMVLMSLFPFGLLARLRPVAAADYFLRTPFLAWFALKIIGIIPLERKASTGSGDIFAELTDAIKRGDILILFPEGTRGEPENMVEFKKGISYLAERHPDVPVVPVFLHGLGKSLPKGAWVPVPFFCDIYVGEAILWTGERTAFMEMVAERVKQLSEEGYIAPWE